MYWFAIASLTPAALILLACLIGGLWAWVALIFVTLFVALADRLSQMALQSREDDAANRFARTLGITLALVHFILLAAGIRAIAQHPDLGTDQSVALAIALGLFMGQVSNSNAHELIHASNRRLRQLGVLVYISLLFGHHASAHPKVHHVHVATARDPNSARMGQDFYRFWPQAWIGSFRAGLRAEAETRSRASSPLSVWTHPYLGYVTGGILALGLSWWWAGGAGLAVYLALAGYAQMQLILADYVQHYGLRRTVLDNGRAEPASDRHSWNAGAWFSTAMMLNAPHHSDHHMHPARHFPALRLDPGAMPMLPYSLPVMAAIAMVPPLWRKLMDPRVADWQETHSPGGADPDNLALSPHATGMDDSPVNDGAAGHGRDAADRGGL